MNAFVPSVGSRLRAALFALGLASPILAACGASCEDACENVVAICADDFRESQLPFDVPHCVESCESNQAGCDGIEEETACVASAQKCSDLAGCTRCR